MYGQEVDLEKDRLDRTWLGLMGWLGWLGWFSWVTIKKWLSRVRLNRVATIFRLTKSEMLSKFNGLYFRKKSLMKMQTLRNRFANPGFLTAHNNYVLNRILSEEEKNLTPLI